ncbi:ChaN family lipoprotein [Kinneretia asaccharophila]|uniref:Heme-binding uptake protein ChaN (Tiki superfamily) n=1 Tax=Roseateles asaccharophilus TaxID=582607 RepID=A0A4R6MY89_9BURK|nr:ChaN family lipoprotein [Roseateles asaccharophilus]MDN3545656.1 ChaN family lipoprotein [Roseateles asaccharophilus]TDP07524.1 heme-binding uptake protein ChaN (Tiki superfamily) [Roseateles asaccharophilus]
MIKSAPSHRARLSRPALRAALLLAPALLLSACAALRPAATAPAAPLPTAPFVLLGEVHDNPAHHLERAAQLRRLLADGRRSTVVFEQMGRDQDAALAAAPREAEAQSQAGGLDRQGWRWPLHKPLFEAALAGQAQLRGGNISREQARALVRQGEAAWPEDLLPLKLATPWAPAQQQALQAEIEQGHCGAMPARLLPGMVLAQRGRDAAMAQAMLQARAAGAERVILIAGNGHVRRDLAVPLYLQAAGVPAEQIHVQAYLEQASGPAAAEPQTALYDRVVRTAKAQREDPCAALRQTGKS